MEKHFRVMFVCANLLLLGTAEKEMSAVGDPGMKRDGLRVAFEAWNFCNEVAREAPRMGSPRAADCFDVSNSTLIHKVSEADNRLGVGKTFKGMTADAMHNPDLYAVQKELYLGSLCEVSEASKPWQFWMVMLKNGNFDTIAGLCPENGKKPIPPFTTKRFPCFGKGCMNPPTLNHQPTQLLPDGTMRGWFNGTYDLDADIAKGLNNLSFYEVIWEKKLGSGSWVFNHKLKTTFKYPWLMLYLRADATKGFSGGYHYETRGMLHSLPECDFKVRFRLEVKKGGGPKSQFYLVDIGSCWKNNGKPCDGDVLTDVTRYSEMIINPDTPVLCSPTALWNCPPYHITPDDKKIYRNDTANFPYGAYHYYCAPGNAEHWSNLLAFGQGWVGDPRTWVLDTGGLASRLYFYQDPGTPPAKRIWTSIDMGTEIFVSDKDEVAEWSLSDLDIILM
ncbi:hypothetical protein like AT2G47010 [Hibiscus trionum]|uniref:DUF7705 domain-containing protein n=1 Tax=Hibiscus trionum TaxID=183268 RepID=A0A9W7H4Z9_HIBTR|nr:hypothetical protein like AT2G47010 [Hibiscus trionum]